MDNTLFLNFEYFALRVIHREKDQQVFYCVTRNPEIIKLFTDELILLKDNVFEKNLLYGYDIVTKQVVELYLTGAYIEYAGIPEFLFPGEVSQTELTHIDGRDLQLPFLKQILQLQSKTEIINTLTPEEDLLHLYYNNFVTHNFLETDNDIALDSHNVMCIVHSKLYRDYIKDNLISISVYPLVKKLLQLNKEDITFKNMKDFHNFIHTNTSKIKTYWFNFLKKHQEELILIYQNEKSEIIENLEKENSEDESAFSFEKELVNTQYDMLIDELKNFDYEEEYKNLQSPYMFLKYFPAQNTPHTVVSDLLNEHTWLTRTSKTIIDHLANNGITVDDFYMKVFINEVIRLNEHYIADDVLDLVYLDKIKDLRYQQIIEYGEKQKEILLQEDADIDNVIFEEIFNYTQYQQEINELTSVKDVLQYWPAVLLPAPEYVQYIEG